MAYSTYIPTLEEIRSIKAATKERIRRDVLVHIGNLMEIRANQNLSLCIVDLKKWTEGLELSDINFVQNTLRDLGYMTKWDEPKLIISWSDEEVAALQEMKDNNINWKFSPAD